MKFQHGFFAASLLLAGCGDNSPSNEGPNQPPVEEPETPEEPELLTSYNFDSKFSPGSSSVSYAGQSARHLHIVELGRYLDTVNTAIGNGARVFEAGDLTEDLNVYYRYSADFAEVAVTLAVTPGSLQTKLGDFGTTAQLRGKIAGLDSDAATVMHVDWASEFKGWDSGTARSPDALAQHIISKLDAAAVAYSEGSIPLDPSGNGIAKMYVSADGVDHKELLSKFLLGAVMFSQAADDYLDDDVPGKGMLSSNLQTEGQVYSGLEHAWDEGFGYFGAARNYAEFTDEEIAARGGRDSWKGYNDADNDGKIDFAKEYIFGASSNAAKRDLDSATSAPTDFTRDAFAGFVKGRALIASVTGELSEAQITQLRGYRDQAVQAWEKAIAASCVHYINAILQDMNAGAGYVFLDHAKHWSEMKGFALSLQFNRLSPMLAEFEPGVSRFVALHGLIGNAPVLLNSGAGNVEDYKQQLLDARAILGTAYGFAAANLGDNNGEGGW